MVLNNFLENDVLQLPYDAKCQLKYGAEVFLANSSQNEITFQIQKTVEVSININILDGKHYLYTHRSLCCLDAFAHFLRLCGNSAKTAKIFD